MYTDLYVKLNRAYGYGDAKAYFVDGVKILEVFTPSEDIPYDPYRVIVQYDWAGDEFPDDDPFQAGQVVKVTNGDPTAWEGPVDVYDE